MNWKSDKIDELSKNQIWRGTIQKEREHHVSPDAKDFRVNPASLAVVTGKCTEHDPTLPPPRRKKFADLDETDQALSTALQDSKLSPSEKYWEPQTSAQEYGWISTPLSPPGSQFRYPRTACEVTQYATAYSMSSGGVSPYARKANGSPTSPTSPK
jgi:hypothetical protein